MIIDDEPSICSALSRFFRQRGADVTIASSAEQGIERLASAQPDVIFLDIRLPGINGLEAIPELSHLPVPPAIIVMTAYGTMSAAIEAMRKGAYDYLVKPVSLDRAAQLVDRLMESRAARQRIKSAEPPRDDRMIGHSHALQELFKQIGAVAAMDVPVLIVGETGSGKQLVAQAIHAHGDRSSAPLVELNISAMTEAQIGDALFGAAGSRRPGKLEEADHGTLLLDGIDELPPGMQARLLRFLDDGLIQRGAGASRAVDARLLATSIRDPQELVAKGTFRADLLHRLNVARLRVPPLRERREDIADLSEHFLKLLSGEKPPALLTEDALARLRGYDWPGNVRELRNVLQQALLVAREGAILPSHLPPLTMPLPGDDAIARRVSAALDANTQFAFDAAMQPFERELLRQVMERHAGNLSRAAEQLGLHRATLRSKLKQHGLGDE